MAYSIEVNQRKSSRLDLAPVRAPSSKSADDHEVSPDALDRESLENFIAETRNEPPWRQSADIDCDYYDANQLRPDTLGEMEDRGIPPIIINLTKPIVNVVLGMEAKTRTDWEVTADDKQSEPVAQLLDQKLNEAERESGADRAISDAYAASVKGGLGWVEVGRNPDPFGFAYRVNDVHRREIWWDWRSRRMDLSDARYLVRRRWFDQDVLEVMLPQFKDLVAYAINSWSGFSLGLNTQSIELARSYTEQRASTLDEYEWLDTGRRRAQVYEVWYRKWVRGWIMRLPNGKAIEVDKKNPRHMEIIASGYVNPISAVFPKVRVSMWLGPHRLTDNPSPFSHRHFPYVPFWGYREDLTGAPYGIIRDLRSPQDEINARRSKLMALITGRRVIMDNDALDQTFNTADDVADEVGRADAMVVLNAQRKNADGFRVETNGDLAIGQMKTLDENKEEMHQVSGVFPPAIGDSKDALSGVAIDSLVEQSATTLAALNDNHRFARRQVGTLLLSCIREDLTHEHEEIVGRGRNAKSVYFNREFFSPEEKCNCIENSVADANVKVTLSDVPSTATYKRAQFARLAELTKGLPPEVQKFVIDFVIEASDVKDASKIAERLRRALNIPDPNADEQDAANDPHVQQIQQMQAEHEQVVSELMSKLQPALAEVERLRVENANKQAATELEIERERTRQAEVAAEAARTETAAEREHRLELEKLDLAHEELAAKNAQATREFAAQQQAAAAPPVEQEDDGSDEKIASAMDDVRDMVKALADEIGRFEKEVSGLKKEAGKPAPEPVKAEDIAAALTKALAPILESKKEEKSEERPPAQPIVVVVPASEVGESEKTITFQADANGIPKSAVVSEKRKKPTGPKGK